MSEQDWSVGCKVEVMSNGVREVYEITSIDTSGPAPVYHMVPKQASPATLPPLFRGQP